MSKAIAALFLAVSAWAAQDKPFNGKDLSGWAFRAPAERNKWRTGKASLDPTDPHKLVVAAEGDELVNAESHSVDAYTEATWGDCLLEVEVMVPKGSNSGIYLMGEYEVQVLDSFGKEKIGQGDMGGIYGGAAPRVNASKPPGEWQKFVIDFRAPKFDADGKRTSPAKFVKVELNGRLLHENLEMKGPTPGGLTGKEGPKGPLLLQGDHGAVSYRNVKVTPVP
ncbi:MAG TPA: DUF1080 domain-containing protein [Planctomycetota bacterium]|nr:DUF1080 domain-containing protein [Planctomycetota bacterium]